MTEKISFRLYGFDIGFRRDAENLSIVKFEISKKDWSAEGILEFFMNRLGGLKDLGNAFELKIPEDWIRIHKLMLLIKSYFVEDAKLEDWISIEPEKVKVYFMKPKIIGLPKVLEGIIGFDHNYERFLGRSISLEEAKEVFMSLFKYPIMKEGLEALMNLLDIRRLSKEPKNSNS